MLSASQMAWMSALVAKSLDVTVTRVRDTKTGDGYGHTSVSGTSSATYAVNIIKPSSTQLQAFAGIIGSQWALMMRFMPSSDIKEGDHITYNGHSWLVENIQNSESYTFANEALITTVV